MAGVQKHSAPEIQKEADYKHICKEISVRKSEHLLRDSKQKSDVYESGRPTNYSTTRIYNTGF
jgi:hypothetical protein